MLRRTFFTSRCIVLSPRNALPGEDSVDARTVVVADVDFEDDADNDDKVASACTTGGGC
jgi:hypothetical protein